MKLVIPDGEYSRIRRNTRIFIAIFGGIGIANAPGVDELHWYLVLPWLPGRPSMRLISLIQQVEMLENSPSIIDSTCSLRANPLITRAD